MPGQPQIPPSDVAELIRIARQHGLSEIAVQQGSSRVELRLAPAVSASGDPLPRAELPAVPSSEAIPDVILLRSPMTGVYYLAPTPNDPPYIHPGDVIREGDPIGLIEAMKVFSEVLADHSGRVRRIVAENSQLVQQGDSLVELAPFDPTDG